MADSLPPRVRDTAVQKIRAATDDIGLTVSYGPMTG
jgi:hypothetical protein